MSALNFHKLEGIGLGLLVGLVIGLSDADWIRLLLVIVLIAFTGKSMKNALLNSETDQRFSFTGISAFFAVVLGLYISGQQYFRQSPSEIVTTLIQAGYTPSQAREIYVKRLDKELKAAAAPAINLPEIIKSVLNQNDTDTLNAGKKYNATENEFQMESNQMDEDEEAVPVSGN